MVTSQPVATVSATVAETWMQAFTHTQTHTQLYMLTHTCLHLLTNKNTTERERKGRGKSTTSHTAKANTLLAVLPGAAYANYYTTAPELAL